MTQTKPISRSDAFDLGFAFANSLGECYDSRDVSRVLTREDFPVKVQEVAGRINGFRLKDQGIYEAMQLIREVLQKEEDAELATLRERLAAAEKLVLRFYNYHTSSWSTEFAMANFMMMLLADVEAWIPPSRKEMGDEVQHADNASGFPVDRVRTAGR